jgi:predicted 2-oxoglutarate/Fe(II)-dependent dioxygenase YbiX
MTVQVVENFMIPTFADSIIRMYSHKLTKVEERTGFYEDIDTPRETLRPLGIEHKDQLEFKNDETENEKQAIILMNNIIHLAKKQIESFYNCKELTSFEGGLVKLTEGANNGLHSDMYKMDGSMWDDGTERKDELEYSALFYMSDYGADFTGGKIYFPQQDLEIRPEKGMLVFFRGDLEHTHEVTEVFSGERYAIVMFFG